MEKQTNYGYMDYREEVKQMVNYILFFGIIILLGKLIVFLK